MNPVETAWSALKDYVRKNNISFSLNSVHNLIVEFIAGYDDKAAQAAIRRAEQVEATYKAADEYLENIIEPRLLDDDDSDAEDSDHSDISDNDM